MNAFPEYQDSFTLFKLKKGELPFSIQLHNLQKTFLHHHDFVELSYVLEGRGHEIINGKKHLLAPGTCSFLLPHHMHFMQSQPDADIVKYCCMFDINILFGSSYDSELYRQLFRIGTDLSSFTELAGPEAKRMEEIMGILHDEFLNPGAVGRKSLIRAKLTEALLLFIRASIPPGQRKVRSPDTEDKMNFWSILQYVHVHFAEKLTLEALSRQFRISVPYISRSFKENIGKNFLDYVHELRIKSAASMLVSTNMAIIDIAVDVGFDSFRTFSRVFRELLKQTPSHYRKTHEKMVSDA